MRYFLQKYELKLSHWGGLLACLFFIIPLCSLPPFRIGYFAQVETSLFAFWGLSALSSLWIYFLNRKNPQLVLNTSRLPVVWGPIFLGTLTLIISLFHPVPLRDFVGSGQIGEGALTFIASGFMACHFLILTRIKPYQRIIISTAILVGIIISALTIVGSMDSPFINWRYWQWAPFFFPDFLAFIDIALITIYLMIRKEIKRLIYFYDIIAWSSFSLIAYFANNKSLTYGLAIAVLSTLTIRIFSKNWRRILLQLSFFTLTIFMTLLIVFYDDFSRALPESLKALGHLSTITSRTWLSKVALVDLWINPISFDWIQQLFLGNGWGSFSNISAANMFLIDQVSLFTGEDYRPSWELVNRDLMHTHNILTNIFHSIGLLGIGLYLYTQKKLIDSLSQNYYLIGATFIVAYQIQLLFWFQFAMTLPFTLLTLALMFRHQSGRFRPCVLKPFFTLAMGGILLIFTGLQGYLMVGYGKGLIRHKAQSNIELVTILTTAPYVHLEVLTGAQRQVALARLYSIGMQNEFKDKNQLFSENSLNLVKYLNSLSKDVNYLANNVALNILGELASKPETQKYLTKEAFSNWEDLVRKHIEIMPYRSDILVPFFNYYQSMSKDSVVLEFTRMIYERNPRDSVALWFMGSSHLKDSAHFNKGMCMLQKSLRTGIERFMPVPEVLKSKILTYAQMCP